MTPRDLRAPPCSAFLRGRRTERGGQARGCVRIRLSRGDSGCPCCSAQAVILTERRAASRRRTRFSAPVTSRISTVIIQQNSTPVKSKRLSKSHSSASRGGSLFVAFAMTGRPYSSPPMSAAAPMSKEEVPAPSAKARGGESRWMGARLCSFM